MAPRSLDPGRAGQWTCAQSQGRPLQLSHFIDDFLEPMTEHWGIHKYRMLPEIQDTHVDQLITLAGGSKFPEVFASQFAHEMAKHRRAALVSQPNEPPPSQCPLQPVLNQLNLQLVCDDVVENSTAPELGDVSVVARAPLSHTMLGVHAESGAFQLVIEDSHIRCNKKLPLGHAVVMRTVLPPHTQVKAALGYMKAMHDAIRTGIPENLHIAVPNPVQRYVIPPTNPLKNMDSLEGDVVSLISDFALKFVRDVRKRAQKISIDMDNYIRKMNREEEEELGIVAPASPHHDAQDGRVDTSDDSEDEIKPAGPPTQDDVARTVTHEELKTFLGSSFRPTIGIGGGGSTRDGVQVSLVALFNYILKHGGWEKVRVPVSSNVCVIQCVCVPLSPNAHVPCL